MPIWGLFDTSISGSAPYSANVFKTKVLLPDLSFITEFSLPSEKVPAPPSPNSTFDSGLRGVSPFQKSLTHFVLLSTSIPRSNTIGLNPSLASINAANNPAGPIPTTTGGALMTLSPVTCGIYSTGVVNIIFLLFTRFNILFSLTLRMSQEMMILTSFIFLSSMDSLDILYSGTVLSLSCLFISASRSLLVYPGLSFILFILIIYVFLLRLPFRLLLPMLYCSLRIFRPHQEPHLLQRDHLKALTPLLRD